MALNQNGPRLWLVFTMTVIQTTIMLYAGVNYMSMIDFCRGASVSGAYPKVKTALLLSFFSYVPFWLISIAFMWISWSFDWASGYLFLVLPFLSIVVFLTVLMITRNDISNFVDVQRNARSRLPSQPIPMPLTLGEVRDVPLGADDPLAGNGAGSPVLVESSQYPPALPLPEDDDAFY